MVRVVKGSGDPIRIVIADDSALIFSDDYRSGWVKGFKALGCEVQVFDISKLRQFSLSPMSPYSTRGINGLPKMLARNVIAWNPDLVFCHHGRSASANGFLEELHRCSIRTAAYLCDEPYESGMTLGFSPRYGNVFTMDACTVEAHKKARKGRNGVFYLPPGVDTGHFKYVNYEDRPTSALFLGNAGLIPRKDWLAPIERVVEGTDIRFWPERKVTKGSKGWVGLKDHPELYSSCLVGLNVHRNPSITKECFAKRVMKRPRMLAIPEGMELCKAMPAQEGTGFWNDANLPASHVNPRFLEMAACGTLVVSDDHRSEAHRILPMAPKAEDPAHFMELVHYYLDHLREAEEIGRACSYLISKRHTYRHRAGEVLIRVGLQESRTEGLLSSLGEPEDWLSPQPSGPLKVGSSLGPTGLSERWSPAFGMLSTQGYGSLSEADSLDLPPPYLA